jgi:predicted XRE-type DNA-binding protein
MKSKEGAEKIPHLTRGSVLDDLGFSPAEALEIKVKADIYRELRAYVKSQAFTQQQLADRLGIHQPDVSLLLSGKISKFSVGKLLKFAGRLNLGAQVRLTRPKETKPPSLSASAKPHKREPAVA